MNPGHVAHHSGVYTREVGKSTASAPADHTHLDPGAVPPAYQRAPGVTLWEKARVSTPGIPSCQGGWAPVCWVRKRQRREDSQAITWQESWPFIPAQSMSSLIILMLLFQEELVWYLRSQSLFLTMGTVTSLR